MIIKDKKVDDLCSEVEGRNPIEILKWAVNRFGKKVKLSSSLGLEDQVITHMITEVTPELEIFTLDTGRLFKETYDLIQKIEERYNMRVQIYFPDTLEVEDMVKQHGTNLFYQSTDLRKFCCSIRKVNPLKRALAGLDAWICGLRTEQSKIREQVHKVDWDKGNGLYKISPIMDWSERDVWDYIKANNIPYNELHHQNYPSIGCSCCTRATAPGEDPRAGRWWWESQGKKECGLHFENGKAVRGHAPS